jgi:hypothetical protein
MKKDNQFHLQHILSTEIDTEGQDWLETGETRDFQQNTMLIQEKEEIPNRPKLSAWDNEEDADDKLK